MGKTKLEHRVERIEDRWEFFKWILKLIMFILTGIFYYWFVWVLHSFTVMTLKEAYFLGIFYTFFGCAIWKFWKWEVE